MEHFKDFIKEYKQTANRLKTMYIVSLIFFILFSLLMAFFVYLQYEKPIKPMFVGVDSVGNIRNVGDMTTNINIDNVKQAELLKWLVSCRTLSTDPLVRNDNLRTCSSKLEKNSEAYKKIDSHITNINKQIQKKISIIVKVKSILKTDSNKYLIEYIENYYDQSSTNVKRSLGSASIETFYHSSNNSSLFLINPLGMYIKSINFTNKT